MGKQSFGIDIGGSGIKGAVVDVERGELASERIRIPTPKPATIDSVLDVVADLVAQSGWDGSIGCAFPGIVRHGVIGSAANVDEEWIGVDLAERVGSHLGRSVVVLNDADAAGLAEIRFGAGKDYIAERPEATVLLATLGTGIGSALFVGGTLVPNTELGHLELDGRVAEKHAAASAKEREDLSYPDWARRLQRYFSHVERLLSPDLIIIGGGASKKADEFLPLLDLQAEVVPAQLRNGSGIVGAAEAAVEFGG